MYDAMTAKGSVYSEVDQALQEQGYWFSSNLPEHELQLFCEGLGDIRVDPRTPELIRSIRPQATNEAKPNTLSSRYGLNSFPFHTDVAHWQTPARLIVLYCVCPGSGARPTHLQDTNTWCLLPKQWQALTHEPWKTGHVRPKLCTVISNTANGIMLRFNRGCMAPLTKRGYKLGELVDAQIKSTTARSVMWSPGDVLVIDNYRMLHSRGRASESDGDRVIQRVLIDGEVL